MCGRYTLSAPLDDLVDVFEVPPPEFPLRPRYNIAPSQEAPVVLRGDTGRRLGLLRWGLVPRWADDPSIGSRMINARSETIRTKPAFREAFLRRRCLVPADGFFEWRKPPAGSGGPKRPYWIHRPDRRPFAMAGLWERWEGGGTGPLTTFTILTTEASGELRSIHSRMPVVLPPESWEEWLDPDAEPSGVERWLQSCRGAGLEAWEVSTLVNSPANDVPECIAPLEADGADGGASGTGLEGRSTRK